MDIPYGGRQHVLVFVDHFSGSHAWLVIYKKRAVLACLSASIHSYNY
jgi:hypothetical protein